MLQISVTADIKEASRYLRKVGERNIPLAVAQALTGTAKHLAKVQARSTALHFDRPTKFTQRAFGVRMAKAADYKRGTMFSRVFAKDIQAGYLKFGVEGGRRTPKVRAIVVPGPDTKLNRYGKFTRNYIKTQLANFYATSSRRPPTDGMVMHKSSVVVSAVKRAGSPVLNSMAV